MRVWCERFEPFYVDVKGVQEVMASRKPEALWFMAHQAFMKVVCQMRSKMFKIFHCIIFSQEVNFSTLAKDEVVKNENKWFMTQKAFMKVCPMFKMFFASLFTSKAALKIFFFNLMG